MTTRALLCCLLTSAAFGQAPSFDAVSIKPTAESAMGGPRRIGASGGPGSKDPGFFKCDGCPVSFIVLQAYDIKRYQLSGQVAAIDADRFDFSARVPEGATKEQFRLMLQNLLAERFKLKVHHETKEMPMYELVVAKNGPKLKEARPSDPDAPPDQLLSGPRDNKMAKDKDGYPILPAGANGLTMMMNGRARTQGSAQTMEQFAGFLGNQIGKPVTDKTGLKGKYDYTLSWAIDMSNMHMGPGMGPAMVPPPAAVPDADADSGPALFTALQEQLGLRLESKKGPVDIVVIDHADKTPTEN